MLKEWVVRKVQPQLHVVCLLLLLSTLMGCSQAVLQAPDEGFWQIEDSVSVLRVWSLSGRIAVATEEESVSASINWIHRVGMDVIELSGPLGQGRVKLTVTGESILVDDGERSYRDNVDLVLSHYLKTTVPVSALSYWLVARVAPTGDFTRLPQGFEQFGWQVSYRQMQQVEGYRLPKRMRVEKAGIKLKLIVDEWEIG